MEDINFKEELKKTAFMKMPFGKYKGKYLSDIPENYYVWFATKGFPDNKLGLMMQSVYEMKINGLEYMLREIRTL